MLVHARPARNRPRATCRFSDKPPACRSERRAWLCVKRERTKARVSKSKCRTPRGPIKRRAGVRTAIRGNARDFECHSVVEPTGNWSAYDGYPANGANLIRHGERELVSRHRLVVPMMLAHKSVSFIEIARYHAQSCVFRRRYHVATPVNGGAFVSGPRGCWAGGVRRALMFLRASAIASSQPFL